MPPSLIRTEGWHWPIGDRPIRDQVPVTRFVKSGQRIHSPARPPRSKRYPMRQGFESSPIQPEWPAPEVISAASADSSERDHDGQARTATACTKSLFHILHKGAAVSASH